MVYSFAFFLTLGTNVIDASFEPPLDKTSLQNELVSTGSLAEYTVVSSVVPHKALNLRYSVVLYIVGMVADRDISLFEGALSTVWGTQVAGGRIVLCFLYFQGSAYNSYLLEVNKCNKLAVEVRLYGNCDK